MIKNIVIRVECEDGLYQVVPEDEIQAFSELVDSDVRELICEPADFPLKVLSVTVEEP